MKYNFKGIPKNEPKNFKIGLILPSVVVGCLIALKHIGMTSMTYWAIILFGIEIWLCCIAFLFVIFLIILFVQSLFGGFNKI